MQLYMHRYTCVYMYIAAEGWLRTHGVNSLTGPSQKQAIFDGARKPRV